MAIGLLAVMALFSVGTARAALLKDSSEQLNINEEQAVVDDLYVAASAVNISSDVAGDVFAAAGTININAGISQSVFATAGTVTLEGTVGQSARLAGGTITINGAVKNDLLLAGGTVSVEKSSSVGRDLFTAGGTVTIAGNVGRNVKVSGGAVTLSGTIAGNFEVWGGMITLAKGTAIGGDFTYTSKNDAAIASNVKIGGKTTKHLPPQEKFDFVRIFVWGWLSMFVIAVLLWWLLPRKVERVTTAMRMQFWKSLGIGFLALFGIPLVAFILLFSVLLIPVSVGLALAYPIALYLSTIYAAIFIGGWIAAVFGRKELNVWAILLGIVVLGLVGFIPFVGWLIRFMLAVAAFGGIIMVSYAITKELKHRKEI